MPTVPLGGHVLGADPGGLPGGPADHDEPPGNPEQFHAAPADGAADPVQHQAGHPVTEGGGHLLRPVRFAVVDRDVRAQPLDQRDLRRPTGQTDHVGPGTARGLHEQTAETTGGRRDQHHVTAAHLGKVEHGQRGPTGTDHGDSGGRLDPLRHRVHRPDGGHRELRVATAGPAEVGHHGTADPTGVDPAADRVDRAGHLPPRGHRQSGRGHRAAGPTGAQHGVQQVHTGRPHRDPQLTGRRLGIGHPLVAQCLRGTESVLSDREHAATVRPQLLFRSRPARVSRWLSSGRDQ